MIRSPLSPLCFVASELRRGVVESVASVAFVVSPVASVASSGPRSVLASALLRARQQYRAKQVQRIALRRRIDAAGRDHVSVPRCGTSPGQMPASRLN